jgi:MFS family permease
MGQNGRSPEPPGYKWVVLGITTIGVLMVSIDTTVVILAFPDIMVEPSSDLVQMVWVLLAYIFASTVFLLALGRVADIYGRIRLYNLGFALFTIGSAFCGLAASAGILIASRVFQGIGGALMLVNASFSGRSSPRFSRRTSGARRWASTR